MDKRIIIFSPESRDLEEIALTTEDYFKKNFKRFLPIEMQKFFTLSESSRKGYSLGEGGEILLIFDRRLNSRGSKPIHFEKGKEREALTQMALKMSRDYCDKIGIPYIQYEGEIRNREEYAFIAKIDAIKDKLQQRLEKYRV